ncbi:SusD-like starch-binding protein associating with outer membrane [Mucilaginibacter gracilis]|uniref:SusD-like starch-binding protein associating with outer membrane n=1 Tax=Mucilaginibacter gracilis TaxID=423350 RepID=A0A495J526_9SPHI|nr:RagB/SusD family nutrient uptake outer membrane protein [Mucilaginibacter gracilis]RKR84057.1 SusD-like starch-binding protein associating with outer membrane [Mucilaginibacter gracilis]
MNKIKILILSLVLLSMGACRKYVEIPPNQVRALKTTADYQLLLNAGLTIEPGYYYPIFAGDDFGVDDAGWYTKLTVTAAVNTYTFADKIYGSTEEDVDWASLYKQIYVFNTVATGVMGSTDGNDDQKKAIQAAALVHRAYNYFTLVNIYAKQYDAATAASDQGVPLLLTTNLFADLTRASVQAVYDQVKADLLAALPVLPDSPTYDVNPSKMAVYALMARVCLNTREFTEAERYANLALALKSTLLDLNNYVTTTTTLPLKLANPEVMFFKRSIQNPTNVPLQPAAVALYDTRDLRYLIFTQDGSKIPGSTFTTGRGLYIQRIVTDGFYIGPGVPEMMLIKAECEARAGSTANAMSAVNTLRKKRFKPAEYYDLTAADPNTALHVVIDERQREFMGRGYRWFDQRRLTKDSGFIGTVTHIFKGASYTLAPGDNHYVFPIADKYINLNPEIAQNPR